MQPRSQQLLWRLAALACAAALGLGGAVLVALGSCHDSGGFCAGYFGATHVVSYSLGVVLMSTAVALVARTVTRRRRYVVGTAALAMALLVVLVVVSESTG